MPGAADIVLFRCSAQPGITLTYANVRDEVSINAPPRLQVQIAPANASTCTGVFSAPSNGTFGEGLWSNPALYRPATTLGYSCLRVSKVSGAAQVDDYQFNHGCYNPPNPTQAAPTFIKYIQNQ